MLSTDRIKIRNIIEKAFKSEILIPEFQRDFIWKAEDIKELLTSILGGYFIGTILFHQNTKGKIDFQVKPLPALKNQNVKSPDENTIVNVVLDGQQRLNSILYSITPTDQVLQGSKNPHRFYLYIPQLIKGELQDSIVYATESETNREYRKILQKEYFHLKEKFESLKKETNSELKFQEFLKNINGSIEYINLSKLISNGRIDDTIIDEIYDNLREILEQEKAQKVRSALRRFFEFEVFYITVPQDVKLEDVVEIFERINRTSYKLSTTDLLFAKLRKEGLKKQDVEIVIEEIKDKFSYFKDLKELNSSLILKVLALLLNKEPKPKQLITISAKDFKSYKETLEIGLEKSLDFLQNELGTVSKNLPYTSMLVPLVAMFAFLTHIKQQTSDKEKQQQLLGNFNFLTHMKQQTFTDIKKWLLSNEDILTKYIKQWYFLNVFSERYDEGAATKSYQDFKNFLRFINELLSKGRDVEEKIQHFIGIESINLSELLKPKAKSSALLKGFIALLLLNKVKDFASGNTLTLFKATDEHIFPKKFFSNKKRADIVLNRTLSSSETNKILKGAQKPSEFLKKLKSNGRNTKELNRILKSHFINEAAIKALEEDDFENFIAARLKAVKKFLINKGLIPKDLIKT
ncbi:DUF262 domain-containing protein [Thermovibrio ammonificans]|nr:DUF262 domain-containing protein [Thermovibrio ammonificans]